MFTKYLFPTTMNSPLRLALLSFVTVTLSSVVACTGQEKVNIPSDNAVDTTQTVQAQGIPFVDEVEDNSISEFIRRIFQDQRGHLWLGTNGDGVARYDGDTLEYFMPMQGFGGVAVRGIVEDSSGNVWFGHNVGITKYDGERFTNYTEFDGLINNDVWALTIDSDGLIWVGTLGGVSTFDGTTFKAFELPASEPDPYRGVTSADIVHCIIQDNRGRMWFATNGGVYIWDGKSLEIISEKDGLCHNTVNCILQASNGDFWFATHHNGVCRWDGTNFSHIGESEGVTGIEAWDVYEDQSGNIWFPIENSGLYRCSNGTFTKFNKEEGINGNAIQCTYQDKQGRLWSGGYMGLHRFNGEAFVEVLKDGPWED